MLDSATNNTPLDSIEAKDLEGWIRYDSSRMCKDNNEKK